ncbi:MAG: exodeoxyribonuclease VII large subunit, partial [Myxococcota bacterium]
MPQLPFTFRDLPKEPSRRPGGRSARNGNARRNAPRRKEDGRPSEELPLAPADTKTRPKKADSENAGRAKAGLEKASPEKTGRKTASLGKTGPAKGGLEKTSPAKASLEKTGLNKTGSAKAKRTRAQRKTSPDAVGTPQAPRPTEAVGEDCESAALTGAQPVGRPPSLSEDHRPPSNSPNDFDERRAAEVLAPPQDRWPPFIPDALMPPLDALASSEDRWPPFVPDALTDIALPPEDLWPPFVPDEQARPETSMAVDDRWPIFVPDVLASVTLTPPKDRWPPFIADDQIPDERSPSSTGAWARPVLAPPPLTPLELRTRSHHEENRQPASDKPPRLELPRRKKKAVLSVSELQRTLRVRLETEFGTQSVRGEISNLRVQSSGHAYFTLKDRRAQLNCVMFAKDRSRLPFRLDSGLSVVATGQVTIYDRSGSLQLRVLNVEPEGEGALWAQFQKRAAQLRAEGLTDAHRKRALPPHPQCVGIVTSRTGAALRDLLRTIWRRDPAMRVRLCHAQ